MLRFGKFFRRKQNIIFCGFTPIQAIYAKNGNNIGFREIRQFRDKKLVKSARNSHNNIDPTVIL
jgi:hypothetical protein